MRGGKLADFGPEINEIVAHSWGASSFMPRSSTGRYATKKLIVLAFPTITSKMGVAGLHDGNRGPFYRADNDRIAQVQYSPSEYRQHRFPGKWDALCTFS